MKRSVCEYNVKTYAIQCRLWAYGGGSLLEQETEE